MLSGAGLRNDPSLAHADRKQPLTERVVDLVGTGVAQIFTLEIDLRSSGQLRESRGEEEGGRPAHEGSQKPVELRSECRICDCLGVRSLQLFKRRGECFGNVPPAVSAETSQGIGHLRERGRSGRNRWHGSSHRGISIKAHVAPGPPRNTRYDR